jgi:hypothetical protein
MKLWLLKPRRDLPSGDDPWALEWDKAWGFVVRAETEEDARRIATENGLGELNEFSLLGNETDEEISFHHHFRATNSRVWLDAKYSTCVELTADGEAGMILKDYLNG